MQQIIACHVTYSIGDVFYWCTSNIIFVVFFLFYGSDLINILAAMESMGQTNQPLCPLAHWNLIVVA